MKLRVFYFLLTVLLLAGCASTSVETEPPASETAAPTEAASSEPISTEAVEAGNTVILMGIDTIVDQMTLREKVGQLFIVRPDALDPSQSAAQISDSKSAGVTALNDAMAQTLKDYPVGGIVMFSKNITSPQQITAFHQALQNASRIPLFLSVDEEGGDVSRLANHKSFDLPQYKNAASIQNAAQASEMGRTIGSYLKSYGFNMDFAPVADVNTNPNNPVIGSRAFSSDARTAAELADAMSEGLQSEGVIAVFKHFPGHGDTAEDSHSGIAVSYKTEAELLQCEWLPFLEAGAPDCVMVGHIALPNVTGDLTPASLSHKIVAEILKDRLGFKGLVITDSMEMGAITDSCSPGAAALAALDAGCDILLMPGDLKEAFDAVVAAVESGTYNEADLNETVGRILQFKLQHGLLGVG